VGFRAVEVSNGTGISIRVSVVRKKDIGSGKNHIDFTTSSTFPCKIGEGEQVKLFVRLYDGQPRGIDGVKQGLLKGNSLSSLKVVVFPSIGKSVVRRFSREVMREFKKT